MVVERYPGRKGRSEYGGGSGSPQRLPDGASLESADGVFVVGGTKGVQRSAQLMRIAGLNDFDPAREDSVGATARFAGISTADMSAAELEAYEKDLALTQRRKAERKRLQDKTNGYIEEPGTYEGGTV